MTAPRDSYILLREGKVPEPVSIDGMTLNCGNCGAQWRVLEGFPRELVQSENARSGFFVRCPSCDKRQIVYGQPPITVETRGSATRKDDTLTLAKMFPTSGNVAK